MKRLSLPFILLLVLAIEGVAIELLPHAIKLAEYEIVPHWVLLILILVTSFYDTEDTFIAIIYGISFGLITDVVYTGVLGVYMFMLGLTLYIGKLLNRLLQANLLMALLITIFSILTMEFGLFLIYSFLGIISTTFTFFITYRFIPTLLANLIFMLVIFYPIKKTLLWMKAKDN